MAISAAIRFAQGLNVGTAGQALIGTTGTAVTCTNGDDSDVEEWKWTFVDVPPGSSVPLGIASTMSGLAFTPDVRGPYHVELEVKDAFGNRRVDRKTFLVLELSGFPIPPFDAVATALNFGGQLRGWAPALETWLRAAEISMPISIVEGGGNTDLATFTRMGVRPIDCSRLPTTLYGKTLKARFSVVLESTAGGIAECRLYDHTHGAVVAGTVLDNSAASDPTLPFVATSAALTVGVSSGNIYRGAETLYEASVRLSSGSSPDVAIMRSARLRFTYE